MALPIGLHSAWDLGTTGIFASRSLGTDTIIETAVDDPVMIFEGISLMDVIPFLALLVGVIVSIGWIQYRNGDRAFHEEIAIPSLHSRWSYQSLMLQHKDILEELE
jgi:hypothetical protein